MSKRAVFPTNSVNSHAGCLNVDCTNADRQPPRDHPGQTSPEVAQQQRRLQMTSSTLNRFTKILVLGAIVAAVTGATALAGEASAVRASAVPDVLERYAAAHPYGSAAVPDVLERYVASHPYGKEVSSPQQAGVPFYTPAMLAAHYNREDRLYNPRPSLPQQAGVPLYTPAMLAAHYNREDSLYNPRLSLPTNPGPTISRGFDWSDWAIGIGTGLGLALILGGGLLIARQLRHRGIQTA